MFKNYMKTAWRNILRNKTLTLINLFGLSVALVAFIFIALWVQNELSFDAYHKDAGNIYLVQSKFSGYGQESPLTSLPVAAALGKESKVVEVARMSWWAGTLNVNGQLFNQKTGIAVDSNWFKLFDYKVVSGDIQSFGQHPFSIIFTESKARQLFGGKDPVGQTIKLDTSLYQVKAIVKDNPVNSSIQFDMLVPMAARLAYRQGDYNNWGNLSYRTFVKVYPGTDMAAFTKTATRHLQEVSRQAGFSIALQPLRELHFDTNSSDPAFRRGSRTAVFVFSVLGTLLLLTASINYVNLSIAKANVRSKEICIRKIIGGNRAQLFWQFLAESFLLCFIALTISLVIISLSLPLFNQLTETTFQLSVASVILWTVLLGTLLFTTLVNGVLPALTMSLFKPLHYLQGYSFLKFRNVSLRKGLVVFQFVIGVIFIIGTITIYLQMRLAQTSAAQYDRAQVVSLDIPARVFQGVNYAPDKINRLCEAVRNDLERSSFIETVALASSSVEGNMLNSSGIRNWYWQEMDTSLKAQVVHLSLSPEAGAIFNFQMKTGRWFSKDHSDKRNYVLNETAVKMFGIRPPYTGQMFGRSGGDTGLIIGVIKDYNFSSLYNKVGPMVLSNNDDELVSMFFVKITPGNINRAMDAITATWKKFIPDAPLDYQFMDEAFDNLYKNDLKISKLVFLFSCISIIISVLGLFGLAAFVAEQKRREIGIRKVMGATVVQIITLLSKDFVMLVVAAVAIASPIAWWAVDKWLQNFVYRVNISWWIFLIAGIAVILISFITISFQSVKAAMASPVKNLRTE
ncbi:FtsX-like permease family protein [Chitinophaga japonensis]|uniref:FtsX-like permease family protein n=2 Tax=Chitinophaga japonensis TaxID=104662 RepID=A0A562STT1_CHIJA|nr:FtsX-like permease family protein [Chitinophaga japonensis]